MHSERVAAVLGTVNFTSPRIIVVIIVDFHREAVYLRKNPRRPFRLLPRTRAHQGLAPRFLRLPFSRATDLKKENRQIKQKYNLKKISRSNKKYLLEICLEMQRLYGSQSLRGWRDPSRRVSISRGPFLFLIREKRVIILAIILYTGCTESTKNYFADRHFDQFDDFFSAFSKSRF